MTDQLKEFWDQRFSEAGYAYGTAPNEYFKLQLDGLAPGWIFVPGAGEGRDAVYAAEKGWQVKCADLSEAGRKKTLQLAAEKNVQLEYELLDINHANFAPNTFDAVAAIYFHLPSRERAIFFTNMLKWLKPGGVFIAELFTPLQLNNISGGPKDPDMLVTAANMAMLSDEMDVIVNEEQEIELNEGKYHRGKGSVVRFLGKKK